jgi:hypothetical protein
MTNQLKILNLNTHNTNSSKSHPSFNLYKNNSKPKNNNPKKIKFLTKINQPHQLKLTKKENNSKITNWFCNGIIQHAIKGHKSSSSWQTNLILKFKQRIKRQWKKEQATYVSVTYKA